MATNNPSSFGFPASGMVDNAVSQFRGLNPNEPGQWPWLPKILVWILAAVAVVVIGWFARLTIDNEELQAARKAEEPLRANFKVKLEQAVNLPELRKQRLQVVEYVSQLEKQLPGRAEMDALLSDINNAGRNGGLQFELFRPGPTVVKDFYAELPISIRVSGRYHEFGAFAADVARLSRIVTLHNLTVVPLSSRDPNSALVMEATARTYRYLDPAEQEALRSAAAAKKKPAGAKK